MGAKTDAGATAPANPQAEPATLLNAAEACARISEGTKAVEALAAFYAERVAAGQHTDTLEAYQAAFDAFMARPVE